MKFVEQVDLDQRMPEIKTEVKCYKIIKICDECGEGLMVATGFPFTSNPPQYPHDCSNPECKIRENYFIQYPFIKYE